MQFDKTQEEAIRLATTFDTQHRIVAIHGQAGTGKTSVMRVIYDIAVSFGRRVVICSPTGKAAKRATELTGVPAVTIHRLLRFSKPSDIDAKTGKPLGRSFPTHGRDFPIPFDVVLVDECSMVGATLYNHLISAIPLGGYLRAFGDLNQLPPIEDDQESSVFEQLINDRPSIKLLTIHRTPGDSSIPSCADTLLKGRIPPNTPDFSVITSFNPLNALKVIVDQSPARWRSLDAQIITAMREYRVGAVAVSQMVQEMVNPPQRGQALSLPRHKWHEHAAVLVSPGDKIIWTENDYELEVFNGETGLVLGWDEDTLDLDFGDRKLSIPKFVSIIRPREKYVYCPWRSIQLAYAITTHKSQGSEWNDVVYMLDRAASRMQTKNNLYTAVTRARQNVTLISDSTSLQKAVSRVKRKPVMGPILGNQ